MLWNSTTNWNNKIETFLKKLFPAQGVVFGFAGLIIIGTILLMLPISVRPGKSITLVDALFTATSASCVTGLVVVDTHDHWSVFGQLIILSLIQIGGLGMLTMATWISIIIGRKVTYKERLLMQESLNQSDVEGIIRLTKNVILVTFAVELIGALLLSIRFIPQFGLIKGLYMGIFHAVSAFCNAGFDLMGNFNSIIAYVSDPLVSFTIAGLFIIGGLGFTVWRDMNHSRNFHKLTLHSKIAIIITIVLLIAGALLFLILESHNSDTLGDLSWGDKILASFFQSATCRTAGYNTIFISGLTEESKLVSIILMFIGASPGSTGGGIKTVTFGVIIFTLVSILKGKENTEILKRTVPHRIVRKSLAIIFFSLSFVLVVALIMAIYEDIPLLNISFEVVSAFGTVGLSTGITPYLSGFSKLLIVLTMFLGRVGPLTLTYALARRLDRRKQNYSYPEGKIMVG